MKAINARTSNEFHVWQREKLGGSCVIQDLDAWGLLVSDGATDLPVCLIELKRSGDAVEEWHPRSADRNNYACLLALARAASIPLYVVYFQRYVTIADETLFRVLEMLAARPEYLYADNEVMTAARFAETALAGWRFFDRPAPGLVRRNAQDLSDLDQLLTRTPSRTVAQ